MAKQPDVRAFTTPPGGVMTQEAGAITGAVEAWIDTGIVRIRYTGALDAYTVGAAGKRTIDDVVSALIADPGPDQYGNPRPTSITK